MDTLMVAVAVSIIFAILTICLAWVGGRYKEQATHVDLLREQIVALKNKVDTLQTRRVTDVIPIMSDREIAEAIRLMTIAYTERKAKLND